MTRRQFAGGAVRTTTSGVIASSGGGTVTITSSTGWPDGSVGKFAVIVDPGLSSEEKILVDSRSGSTLTFSSGGRAYDGSTATGHSSGAAIWVCLTAVDLDEANDHINKTSAAHAGSAISFSPTGTVAATDVQAAIAEAASEADSRLSTIEANSWVTSPRIAASAVTTAKIAADAVTPTKINIYYADSTARAADNASPSAGDLSYIDSNDNNEGVQVYNGTAWRKPWNLPWGYQSTATLTSSSTTGIGSTVTDITSLSTLFTAVGSRQVRIGVTVRVLQNTSTGANEVYVRDASNTVIGKSTVTLAAGEGYTHSFFVLATPSAGATTYKASIATTVGTTDVIASSTQPMFMIVEDIGATGAPA